MPSVKAARPLEIFDKAVWQRLTHVSGVRGIWLVMHAWLMVAILSGSAALLWQWHWLAGLIAAPITILAVGARQLGLSILMHEAAHGLLHPNRKINNFMGQWLTGASTGSDLHAYRSYHLTHHRFTQQAEDPDLALSAPFPTSTASMKRKIIRDLTGQTFFKQRSHQFAKAWQGLIAMLRSESDIEGTPRDTSAGRALNNSARAGIGPPETSIEGAIITAKTVGRFLAVQLALLIISLMTLGVIPFLIWIMALATSFQMVLRIRNIAEHACTEVGSDDPFSHARTTYANWAERMFIAPYWVNYHCEHHLFMGVPCYHLPKAHTHLIANGYGENMTIAHGYTSVMQSITASPQPST